MDARKFQSNDITVEKIKRDVDCRYWVGPEWSRLGNVDGRCSAVEPCGVTWTSSYVRHCPQCHRSFISQTLLDVHYSVMGECLKPVDIDRYSLRFIDGVICGPVVPYEHQRWINSRIV